MEGGEIHAVIRQINKFGKFQSFNFFLICIMMVSNCYFTLSYVFTAGDLNYRCYVEECDKLENSDNSSSSGNNSNETTYNYNTEWLRDAVPYDGHRDKPLQCYRYGRVENITSEQQPLQCTNTTFDRSNQEKCDQFVYENEENTILREYNLHCDENKWKLAMVGTIHNIGILMNLFLSGIISDTYGRRTVFIFSAFFCGLFGLLQTFAPNYFVFLVFKYLQTLFGGGTYSSAVILVVELVPKEFRAAGGTMILVCASFGNLMLGIVAKYVRDWKLILQIGFIPSTFSLLYFWLIPESMKWQLTQGRTADVAKTLMRITKSNNIEMSEQMTNLLNNDPSQIVLDHSEKSDNEKSLPHPLTPRANKLRDVFNSPAMLMRVLCCSFCWFANIIVFYGLSLISVVIGGDKYTNYISVQISQIPACIFVMIIANKVGRKQLLCSSYLGTGAFLLIYTFAPEVQWIKLILYLCGKFCITIAFSTIYIYTSELMPTSLRQTLLGVCSAFGRIGSAIAPQVPLLELILPNLTMYMFGAVALLAGLMVLRFPETLNVELPNTVEEALNLGRRTSKKESINNNNNNNNNEF